MNQGIQTPTLHIVSNCVRNAYLCGRDPHSGRCLASRQRWIERRIALLGDTFAVDIRDYAIAPTSLELWLCMRLDRAMTWGEHEVAGRWGRLWNVPSEVAESLVKGVLTDDSAAWIQRRRRHLAELPCLMRALRQPLATLANREDRCSGKFWERYRCRAASSPVPVRFESTSLVA